MTKHLEIKTYEYFDIKVTVQINYDRKTISLIERCTEPHLHDPLYNKNCYINKGKSYMFINRGLEYMNGWRNVLSGMEYAINQAEKELSEYLKQQAKEKEDTVTDVLLQASDLVKQKKYGNKKKTKKT